jgi:hypothetical protein
MSESISHEDLNNAGSQIEDAATALGMSKTLAVHGALYFFAAALVSNGFTDDDAVRLLKDMLSMIRQDTIDAKGLLS